MRKNCLTDENCLLYALEDCLFSEYKAQLAARGRNGSRSYLFFTSFGMWRSYVQSFLHKVQWFMVICCR